MRRRTAPPTPPPEKQPPRRRTQPVLFLAVCPHSADAAASTAHSQHQHTQATSTSISTSASTRYCASPRSNIIRVIGTPRAQSVVGHALLTTTTTTTNDRDLPVHLQVSVAKIDIAVIRIIIYSRREIISLYIRILLNSYRGYCHNNNNIIIQSHCTPVDSKKII